MLSVPAMYRPTESTYLQVSYMHTVAPQFICFNGPAHAPKTAQAHDPFPMEDLDLHLINGSLDYIYICINSRTQLSVCRFVSTSQTTSRSVQLFFEWRTREI